MKIRIKSPPPGEAPEEVRRAWVGLVLPVPDKYAKRQELPMVGVLSGPRSLLGILFAAVTGRIQHVPGYAVAADTAVEILGKHAPEAASWWRQNAARSIQPGRHFVFAQEACEVIDDGAA